MAGGAPGDEIMIASSSRSRRHAVVIGGSDIALEMVQSGELQKLLD